MKSILAPFYDLSFLKIVFGIILISINCAMVGVYNFLQKKSLLGDVLSHALLPGICIAFIIFGVKNLVLFIIFSLIFGFLANWIINEIPKKSRLKTETASAIVISGFFGLGIIMLTIIQKIDNGSQSGLDQFIFGRAASITNNDILLLSITLFIMLIIFKFFFRAFNIFCFDIEYTTSIGINPKLISILISFCSILAITSGIQSSGIIMVTGTMIGPVVAAKFWSKSVLKLIFISISISVIAGISGSLVSYHFSNAPTGPWIVMCNAVCIIFSILFGTNNGIFIKIISKISKKISIKKENFIKSIYQNKPKAVSPYLAPIAMIQGLVKHKNKRWYLTSKGKILGGNIVLKHRLWEAYLAKYMGLDEFHVHDNAEIMEHYINDDVLSDIDKILDFPITDPHNQIILRHK